LRSVLDRLPRPFDFIAELRPVHLEQWSMAIAMRLNFMPERDDLLNEAGEFLSHPSLNEERTCDAVIVKQSEDAVDVTNDALRDWSVIVDG
jgi:hypothetical protein